jgi:hypothetical protein
MHGTFRCRVVVRGALPTDWTEWFVGMSATPTADGHTALKGELPDQAALHGITSRVRDLGLELVCLTTLPMEGQES